MFGDGYSRYYDLFNSKKPYKKEIKFIYDWADKPKSIFDIGAGTGNYWDHYPKETEIFGIDNSYNMSSRAKDGRNIYTASILSYRHHTDKKFYCATALFDVMNYLSDHSWWKNLPLKKDGYFIFDIWDKEKIKKDGFKETVRTISGITRQIVPIYSDGKRVFLRVEVYDGAKFFQEQHTMYLYSHDDIERFCGKEFEIVSVKPTKRWQTWYKLKRK